MKKLLLPLALLVLSGCSHAQLMERMDAGLALEKEARDLERGLEFAQAADRYVQSEVDLQAALTIAKERENKVFISFLTTKLSISASGQARCTQPDNDPAGSWARSFELYVLAESFATEVMLLKMKANAVSAQAYCRRPDKNPKGDWEEARVLYERSAKLRDGFDDDKGRGEAIRNQVLCMLKGDFERLDDEPRARLLMERARKLGDDTAAEILAGSGAQFCTACGSGIKPSDKHCPSCGHDQNAPAKNP